MDEAARTSVSCIRVVSRPDTNPPAQHVTIEIARRRACHPPTPPSPLSSSEFDSSMRLVISKPDRAYVCAWECRGERGPIHARVCTVSKGRTTDSCHIRRDTGRKGRRRENADSLAETTLAQRLQRATTCSRCQPQLPAGCVRKRTD